MPRFKFTPEHRIFAGFGILFIVTLSLYVGSYITISNVVQIEHFVDKTYQYRSKTLHIRSLFKDAETGARGYVLSGNPNYLKPYNDAISQVPSSLASIKSTNASSAVEIEAVSNSLQQQLKQLIEERANEANQTTIQATLDKESESMNELRRIMQPVDTSSFASLQDYLKRAEAQSYFAESLIPTLGFAVLALFFIVFRQLQAQHNAQKLLIRSERELTMARDNALNASRLKSEFVANISHEIRTPLSGILGMAELLSYKNLDAEGLEISNHLLDSAKHMLTIVNDLLDFSKLEAGRVLLQSNKFSIHDLVDEVVTSVTAEARKKNLPVITKFASNLPNSTVGDETRIKQVLLNLAHNAIKFTSAGSVTIAVDLEGGKIKFAVTDTGIGIEEETKKALFQPFVQADGSTTRVYGGTGLGLSISKNLVHLMQGEIGFSSVKDSGSTFWFTIPLAPYSQPALPATVGSGSKDIDS